MADKRKKETEGVRTLSFKTDSSTIDKLKVICEADKRSQAKEIEFLIDEKFKKVTHSK